jgi:integrase
MACKVKVNRHGYLAFRFYWNGREFWQGTGWKDTPNNRTKAEGKAVEITEEIKAGTFNYLKWFPKGNKAHEWKTPVPEQKKPLTVREYYEQWMLDKVPPLVRKSLAKKYRSHFRAYILGRYGDAYLDAFRFDQIKALRTELITERGLSVKTAKNVIGGTLRAYFRDAKAVGVIEQNPFDDIPRKWWPRMTLPQPDPFTEGERDLILDYLFSKYWGIWPHGCVFAYALFWTGARPSELTARRWKDLDFRKGTLSIHTSRTDYEEGETKTPASNRTICLDDRLLGYLKQIASLTSQPEDYIFTQRDGRPINHFAYGTRYFQGALKVLKIRHRDFYHTRHTFISVQLTHGENVKEIADYVGTSPAMIFSRYGKWLGGHKLFGKAALEASKPKPFPKPTAMPKGELLQNQEIRLVRGRGLEPLRPFGH